MIACGMAHPVQRARTFGTSIDIQASPERVWAVMGDIERWHEWTPSITRVTRLDGGPLRVGSRARVTLSVTFTGPLAGVIAWLYGGLTNRYVAMEADGLRRRAEATPATGAA